MNNQTDLETSIVKRIRNSHGTSDRNKNDFSLKEYTLLEQCETVTAQVSRACQTSTNPVKYGYDDRRRTYASARREHVPA